MRVPDENEVTAAVRYRFRHLVAAAVVRWLIGQEPWWKAADLRLGLRLVFNERLRVYPALSSGCANRLAFLTTFGVTARLTLRAGWIARRMPRGTNKRERKPTGRHGRVERLRRQDRRP